MWQYALLSTALHNTTEWSVLGGVALVELSFRTNSKKENKNTERKKFFSNSCNWEVWFYLTSNTKHQAHMHNAQKSFSLSAQRPPIKPCRQMQRNVLPWFTQRPLLRQGLGWQWSLAGGKEKKRDEAELEVEIEKKYFTNFSNRSMNVNGNENQNN